MNLPQLAYLLGDISIIEVRYGNHVLQRINATLLPEYQFEDYRTGYEILTKFDTLPNSFRNSLRNMTVLTVDEAKVVMQDIDVIKKRVENEHFQIDTNYANFFTYFIWFTVLYILHKTMVYVFLVESSGEHTEGFIYSLIVGILKTIKDFLLNG